jgi:hypothetical protein
MEGAYSLVRPWLRGRNPVERVDFARVLLVLWELDLGARHIVLLSIIITNDEADRRLPSR